jgi:ribosomal-protein-alanine N-acetyltransferase
MMHPRASAALASWPCPLSEVAAARIIANWRNAMAARQGLAWVLHDRQDLRPLGWVSAKLIPDLAPDMAMLSYWTAAAAEGRGYTPEAVEAVLLPVLRWTGAGRIAAPIYPGNTRSTAVARRLGFTYRGFEPMFWSETRQRRERTLCYEATRDEVEALAAAAGRR